MGRGIELVGLKNRSRWVRTIEIAMWTGRKAGTDRSVHAAARFSASGAGIFRALGQSSLSLFFASELSYV
jgi:hypothetical protein